MPGKGPVPQMATTIAAGSPVAQSINHPLLPDNNKFHAVEDSNGDIIMCFRVTADLLKKYKPRMGRRAIDRYLYEEVIYRNVVDHVF